MHYYCPIKYFLGFPCPGCGTTRAIRYLQHGDLRVAFYTNPLGVVISVTLGIYFLVRIIDVFWGTCYSKTIFVHPFDKLKKNKLCFGLIIVLCVVVAVLNACWNYCKGL